MAICISPSISGTKATWLKPADCCLKAFQKKKFLLGVPSCWPSEHSGIHSQLVEQLLACAKDPVRWGEGRHHFRSLRDKGLELDKREKLQPSGLSFAEEGERCLLGLAEIVTKITYNASNPPDSFDEDTGWWLARGLKINLDHLANPELSRLAYERLWNKD